MRRESGLPSTLEITLITGEGLFSSVYSGMLNEIGLLSSLEITLIAGEWLISSV